MWTTDDRWLHRLTNADSMHALAQVHEQTTQNAREHRPLPHALAQVPHKTPLGMKERWHRWMHWRMCITIPQTLEGTQPLFVVNSVKLHLTALNLIWVYLERFLQSLKCPITQQMCPFPVRGQAEMTSIDWFIFLVGRGGPKQDLKAKSYISTNLEYRRKFTFRRYFQKDWRKRKYLHPRFGKWHCHLLPNLIRWTHSLLLPFPQPLQ